MLRIRKLVLAIAAASALSSGMAHALGLGELTLKSAQNQPLDAEIELLDVRDLTAAEVKPSLAPADEFSKAGVERQPFLNDLTFTPVINPAGKSVLKVTSSQPLPEPMVKFLVQVLWPQGRLLRDYSLLLDPSKFSPEAAQAAGVTPASSTPANYTTVRRDTLWEIASRSRQGGSVYQTMLAIQALNPDAFINGNINQLKTGQVLRLPDQQQIQSIPQAQAVKEVSDQYAAWRQGRRLGPQARQLDATRRSTAQPAPSSVAQQDNLKLVAPGGQGEGSDKALSDKLAMTQENLDASRRESDELKSRMTDLQSQLDKLQRLIDLKNDQLARLEAQSGIPVPAPTEAPVATAPVIDAQLQPAPAVEPVVDPAPAAVDTAPPATPPAGAEGAVEPAPDQQPDALAGILGNPTLLALIAGSALLALALLLWLLMRKRKAQQEAEKHLRMARALAEETELGPDLDLPPSSFDGLDIAPPSVKLAPAVVAASAAEATPADQVGEPRVVPVAPAAPKADPFMAEIDDCIAHGRLMQASNLLEPAVEKSPQRSDLRLKLMEVYARQGDRDGFVSQERKLQANPQNLADVESLKSRFPTMVAIAAAGAAAATALDEEFIQDLMSDEPQPEADLPVEDELDSAFDLSLDDLDGLDLETPADQAAVQAATQEPSLDDLDFDTLLQEPAEASAEAAPAAQADAAADLDDLDFDSLLQEHTAAQAEPQPEPEPQATPEPVVADDLDFDSLLQEHTAAQAEPKPEPETFSALDDMDFDALFEEPAKPEVAATDDLADFDLDVADDAPQVPTENRPPLDIEAELAAFDNDLGLEADLPDLELPDDFDLSLPGESDAASRNFAAELDDVNAELDKLSQSLEQPSLEPHFTAEDAAALPDEGEFDYLSGTDEVATKLDLARAYIDMGDHDGARDILDEVYKEGDQEQRREANELRSKLV